MCCSVGENGRHFVEFISSFIFSRCPLLKRPPLPLHASGEVKISTKSGENLNKYLKQIQTAALSSPDAPHPHPTAWENGGKNWKIEVCLAKPETGREKIHHTSLQSLPSMITDYDADQWYVIRLDNGRSKFQQMLHRPPPPPTPTPPLNCTTTLGERSAAALRDDVWEGGRRRRKCFG